MKKWPPVFFILFLIFVTWVTGIFHKGVLLPKGFSHSIGEINAGEHAVWIPKAELGINQLILRGTPLERGYGAGRLTEGLLYAQEKSLMGIFNQFLPNPLARNLFIATMIRWFSGIEDYLEPWMLEEMYGVSLSTSGEFNAVTDRFSRQVAYHGLHEVGQMMIDREMEVIGCTVFALPEGDSWVIGRNFDFEGGQIFDDEKIMKWVFPDRGNAFVSVIWAGMVGAVTGVNEKGVYVSLNAAGSDDFARLGTPSTLVILKALQFADTADEARRIIEDSQMFITDIFVVADRAGRLYRIEKSPDKFETALLQEPAVIANHLVGKTWAEDSTNAERMREGTSVLRVQRGDALLKGLKTPLQAAPRRVLSFLRDKRDPDGEPYHPGNHNAIDSFAATHAVVYDIPEGVLYASQGPGLTGKFIGFDLDRSFRERKPVIAGYLEPDLEASPDLFYRVKDSLKKSAAAEKAIRNADCGKGKVLLDEAASSFDGTSEYHRALGNYYECVKDIPRARESWEKALSLKPAYAKRRDGLISRLKAKP